LNWILGSKFPVGILDEKYKNEKWWIGGLKFTVSWIQQETAMLFNEAQNIKSAGVELPDRPRALAGGTIADPESSIHHCM